MGPINDWHFAHNIVVGANASITGIASAANVLINTSTASAALVVVGIVGNPVAQFYNSTDIAGSPSIAIDQYGTLITAKGFSTNLSTQSTTYTALTTDHTINCDATAAPFTVTLPTGGLANGQEYYIKKLDGTANVVTVTSAGSIDGLANYLLNTQYQSVTVQWDAGNATWWVY